MTYKDLRDILDRLPQDKLDCDVTALLMDSDEVVGVMDFVTTWKDECELKGVPQVEGILDEGHPYLTISY